MRRTTGSIQAILLLAAVCAIPAWGDPAPPAMITLDRPAHFTAFDGSDVEIAAGAYRIEVAGESHLRLLSEAAGPVEIEATKLAHEEAVAAPMAMAVAEENGDDEVHVVLMLPGGYALDAVGSFTGLRPRGAIAPALKPAQLQSAVSQIKVAPANPPPAQAVPPPAMIRVPPASIGAAASIVNRGKWITWNYLAMEHPEIIAQALTDVQAGKQPAANLSGFASQAELADLLKTNWSAEVARLNAASPNLTQAAVIPRGIPLNAKVTASLLPLLPKNLGVVYAGQSALTTVSLTSPGDTYVEARLNLNATNRKFRIVNAVSYTGEIVNGALAVSQVIPGGQYQDVVPDPAHLPAQISKAGFVSILARKGQRIDINVIFEPVALGMTPVGDNEATLELSGVYSAEMDITHPNAPVPSWSRTASMHAYFSGVNFGAILYTDQQHATTLTGQALDMSVLVRNAASTPITGVITAVQLPPGVAMVPVPVSINPLTTQRLTLHFNVAGTARAGTVQPVVVQLTYANQTRPLMLDLSIYDPWVWWNFGGYIITGVDAAGNKTYVPNPIPGIPDNRTNQSGGTGITTIKAWLKNNGDFWWKIATYNQKDVDVGGSDFDVFARWNATASTDKIAVHIGPKTNPQYYESLRNFAPLATSFIAAVEQGLKFSLIDR